MENRDEENGRLDVDPRNALEQEFLIMVKESILNGMKSEPEPGNVDVNLGIVKWGMKPTPGDIKCIKWVGRIFFGLALVGTLVKLAIEVKKGFWE